MPLVSIVIPTYNRAPMVGDAIRSVLGQTCADFELIVVDDGSTDETQSVVAPFLADGRVRSIYQTNQGRSVARNHGAWLARGQFIGFLDSDDRYLPGALDAHLKTFAHQPDAGLVIGGYEYVDEAGGALGARRPWQEVDAPTLASWLFNCLAMPGSVLIRREWVEQSGHFRSDMEMAEDWELYLRLAADGCPMAWTKTLVCQYRQHHGSSIRGIARHRDGALAALDHLFSRPDLPADIVARTPAARAWVYVVFAKKAYLAGDIEAARSDLGTALRLDPSLGGSGKLHLLESLLTPLPEWRGTTAELVRRLRPALPPELKVRRVDLRQALGRNAMSQFFRAAGEGQTGIAAAHLRAGLSLDPRWLVNRGVLAFCIRRVVARSRPDQVANYRSVHASQ